MSRRAAAEGACRPMATRAMPLAILSPVALLAGLAVLYGAGRATGAIDIAGYEAASRRQLGWHGMSILPIALRAPVWLDQGEALRAEFDVEARHGALALVVRPAFARWTPALDAATAYLEGTRAGAVLFVAQAAGWYVFESDPSPNGGPRCPGGKTLKDAILGDRACPTYDVSYAVLWRHAGREEAQAPAGVAGRVAIPTLGGDSRSVLVRS